MGRTGVFTYANTRVIHWGAGSIAQLGAELQRLDATRVGVVTTRSLIESLDRLPFQPVTTALIGQHASMSQVTGIQLVTDSSWFFKSTQTVLVDNVMINGTTFTFESAQSCKDGGWQDFTSAPGPFKNQGDCVSFFATGGNTWP
jgi:hypothetical protein